MWWEAVKCAASGYQYIIMDLPLLFEVRRPLILLIDNSYKTKEK